MRKILILIIVAIGISATSCKKYLDINTNPNSTTSASPGLVLPLAIVNSASITSGISDYGSSTVGYAANAGGYGGFGATWTYDYAPSQGEGFWDGSYTTLENFQYVIDATEGSDANAYYNASAKIMKVYLYHMLVDEFNNVPYSTALKGGDNFVPTYDDAGKIYVSLASLLDSAIAVINNAKQPNVLPASSDPLFGGNMTSWKQFANSLKLRLIIRASGAVQFANTSFTSDGFLTSDAIVNPGYKLATSSSGAQVSPSWASWAGSATGSRVGQYYIPSTYVFGYYNGVKLLDTNRGKAIFFGFPASTPYNQLGITPPANELTSPAPAGAWYSGGGTGTSLGNAIGIFKGPNQGYPLMLLAESDFLQAEADVRGILTQDAATDFKNGIVASFNYLYELPSNTLAPGMNPSADAAQYMADNATNYLVNFSLATTPAQQTEAIITQKYIALNFINGEEAWSEYRRTGYPVNSPTVINNPYGSFTSTQSQATRPDHLPTRLPYPATEAATNAKNVPQGISFYTSTIFWAH